MCVVTTLMAGRSFTELESRALEWKGNIALLYHHNKLRLEHWNDQRSIDEQSPEFQHHHEILTVTLQSMHLEATRLVAPNVDEESVKNTAKAIIQKCTRKTTEDLSKPAQSLAGTHPVHG